MVIQQKLVVQSHVLVCVQGLWAWRTEPWQREVWMWGRGAGEVSAEVAQGGWWL